VSRYQKGKTSLDYTKARDSEWQWHQLIQGCYMQVPATTSRQITMPAPHHRVFLQAGCPSCHPNNSVEALKEYAALRMSADHAECKYAINTKQYQLYFFSLKSNRCQLTVGIDNW